MQVLASQFRFLANRNAGQAIPPLFWPINCIKIGGHVALLSDPTVNCLYCAAIDCLINSTSRGPSGTREEPSKNRSVPRTSPTVQNNFQFIPYSATTTGCIKKTEQI